MKIAMVTTSVSNHGGGVAESVMQLTTELVQQGIDVRVLAFTGAKDLGESNFQIDERVSLFTPSGLKRFPVSAAMYRVLVDWKPDVIHAHNLWQYPSVVTMIAKWRLGIPLILTAHGALQSGSLGVSARSKRIAGRLFQNRQLKYADCLHALNEDEAESFRRYGLVNPICIVPNGIRIPDLTETGHAPWHGHIDPARNVILWIGRFHAVKNVSQLIDGWACAKQAHYGMDKWALVLAGWGATEEVERLRQQVAERQLINDVFFVGPVYGAVKKAAFTKALAVIVPSTSEGLATAVLEAWAYGKPVLMTPACNIPEGFESKAAIEIQPTADSIGSGITELVSMSKVEREQMGGRGLDLVRRKFNWNSASCELNSVYRWLVGRGERPACVSSL
jgi:glycosyltransferase involved in cell wall biosynthesis